MVTTSFDDHPLITYIVFIDAISAAMWFNMLIFLYYKTDIILWYFEYISNMILFLTFFKTLLLWYCVKFSLLISAYIVWFTGWSKKKKLESWSTTSWPPTGSNSNYVNGKQFIYTLTFSLTHDPSILAVITFFLNKSLEWTQCQRPLISAAMDESICIGPVPLPK